MKKVLKMVFSMLIVGVVTAITVPKYVSASNTDVSQKSFYKETSINCNSALGNVFTDGKKLYMYFPGERALYRLVDDYGQYDYSFKKEITNKDIKKMTDNKYSYLECNSLKISNSDFVCINKVVYTIYTFDLKGEKNYVLACLDTKKENLEWNKIAFLPTSSRISMPTLSAYNGNLYVIGGYNEKTKTISKNVYEYNLKEKKWIKKENLPETRFAATANQIGNKLVLSFGGKSDGKIPCNLIYDGKSWKKSKASIDVNIGTGKIGDFKYYKPAVGIVSGGLIYSGLNSKIYGNTFYYDIATDTFKASGYKADDNTIGVAIGNKYFTLSKGKKTTVKSMPVKSALLKLTVRYPSSGIKAWINADLYNKVQSNDNIFNTYYYMPGDIVGFKLSDVIGYYYTHFKVDDKEVNGYVYSGVMVANKEIKVTKARNIDLVNLSKITTELSYYNTLKLTARVTDKNITPIKWESENTKYATVSPTGEITPKVAGLNNSVRIIASTTLYGREISVSCNVRIIRPEISYFIQDESTNSSVTLSWNQIKGADGYDIFQYYYNSPNKRYYKTVNTNKITINNLKPATKYTFIVQAYKIIDNKKCYSYGDYVIASTQNK